MYLKHYMPFQTLYIIRKHYTKRDAMKKLLGLPRATLNTHRNMYGFAMKDVRSHRDLPCNVILFVGCTIYVARSISTLT